MCELEDSMLSMLDLSTSVTLLKRTPLRRHCQDWPWHVIPILTHVVMRM